MSSNKTDMYGGVQLVTCDLKFALISYIAMEES